MKLQILPDALTVCKIASMEDLPLGSGFFFASKTDEEISLVCKTEETPPAIAREDGWRAFRVAGTLDFSLIGILARITDVCAREKIGVFVVSTFNTDYVLVKEEDLPSAVAALRRAGYAF